ncbi:MAG: GNAT family N-acetyltransferase [Anaerolineales bacterium]|nr:GNAT family N-acetyltransferase [Anaerolineales bacterium]
MSNSIYRQLLPSDTEAVAEVISQAFVDDPLVSFMLPIRRTRIQTLKKFFRVYCELEIHNGCGFGVGEPLAGVAFWKFPDRQGSSISVKLLGKLLPLMFTMYPIGFYRAREVMKRIDDLHEKYAAEAHFYLDNLGLLASSRGQGLSSGLIRPFLELADRQKVIAYTDTVTEANVPYYEHFGFKCVEESPVEKTGITVYALRRPVQ